MPVCQLSCTPKTISWNKKGEPILSCSRFAMSLQNPLLISIILNELGEKRVFTGSSTIITKQGKKKSVFGTET